MKITSFGIFCKDSLQITEFGCGFIIKTKLHPYLLLTPWNLVGLGYFGGGAADLLKKWHAWLP